MNDTAYRELGGQGSPDPCLQGRASNDRTAEVQRGITLRIAHTRLGFSQNFLFYFKQTFKNIFSTAFSHKIPLLRLSQSTMEDQAASPGGEVAGGSGPPLGAKLREDDRTSPPGQSPRSPPAPVTGTAGGD